MPEQMTPTREADLTHGLFRGLVVVGNQAVNPLQPTIDAARQAITEVYKKALQDLGLPEEYLKSIGRSLSDCGYTLDQQIITTVADANDSVIPHHRLSVKDQSRECYIALLYVSSALLADTRSPGL